MAAYQFARKYLETRLDNSKERFKQIRDEIKKGREALQKEALKGLRERLPGNLPEENVKLFVQEGWLPPIPIPIDAVKISQAKDPSIAIPVPTRGLPLRKVGKYENYASAIGELDKPDKFENNYHYRLLDIREANLTFSEKSYRYFDKINYGEMLLYDFASLKNKNASVSDCLTRDRWYEVKQPKDYVILAGVNTLTLLHAGDHMRILMHFRKPKTNAYASGTHHVIPAGEFQPSCQAPASFKDDFDLWKCMMREYAEEIGCMDEYDGNNTIPFDYSSQPFLALEEEKAKKNIQPFYLGTGLDPATMQAEIMTVAVFREETFNRIFPAIKTENAEGSIITARNRWGLPFTREQLNSYTEENTLSSGQSILNLAWAHRKMFENCFI